MDSINAPFHLSGIAAEFLAQRHGNSVLQVGPANFSHMGECFGLVIQTPMKPLHGGNQTVSHGAQGCHVNGRRNNVITGLTHVDVVVGMYGTLATLFPSEDLVGTTCDHLVGIHIGRGA